MKWSDKKLYMPRGKEYYKTARKKNYHARCECVDRDHVKYFFYILRKDDYVYISIKHGHAYETEADCMAAAEKHIDSMSAKSNVNKEQLLGFLDVVESTLGKEVKEWVSQKFLR